VQHGQIDFKAQNIVDGPVSQDLFVNMMITLQEAIIEWTESLSSQAARQSAPRMITGFQSEKNESIILSGSTN
jgi:hypothetical protein